jgi:hypothetical protein
VPLALFAINRDTQCSGSLQGTPSLKSRAG